MNVRWNGNILKTYTGTDAGVYMDNLKVTATGNDVLLFEGLTTQSGQTYGFAIKNV